MKAVAVFEAKNRFSELIAAVEQGEEITITRHGAPVARLVAIQTQSATPQEQSLRVANSLQRLQAIGQGSALGGTLREAIESGRD